MTGEERLLHKQNHADIQTFILNTKDVDWKALTEITKSYRDRQVVERFISLAVTGLKAVLVFLAIVGGLYLTIRTIVSK